VLHSAAPSLRLKLRVKLPLELLCTGKRELGHNSIDRSASAQFVLRKTYGKEMNATLAEGMQHKDTGQ